jgi:diadenosine tetraphosphate (Ap4A) HIT family hydrolase
VSNFDLDPKCQFCTIPRDTIALSPNFYAKFDPFPVSRGHALVIPTRHVESLFDLTAKEMTEAFKVMSSVRALVSANHEPDAWNVGVNDGRAAGRTIDHLHIHLIPRYVGDVADPRGGVRKIMPGVTGVQFGDNNVQTNRF